MFDLQVNVVVMKEQNEDEIPQFVEMTRDRPINVRFIEYMPFDGNRWSYHSMVRPSQSPPIFNQPICNLHNNACAERPFQLLSFLLRAVEGGGAFSNS